MTNKIQIPSFDSALETFEKDGDKADKREAQKVAKYKQIKSVKEDLETQIFNMQKRVKKSYIDPSIDTISAIMDLEVLKSKLSVAEQVMKALFPNGIAILAESEAEHA